jgi:2-hydroxy-6-oxonona-2,4-dienedioate hydrolase
MLTYPFGAGDIVTRLITAGNGEVVVLLHGFTSRADRWRGTIGTLAAQGYHVFAPDLPGHGFATKDPAFDHSVSGYRDFVLDLIARLRLDRVNLVGTSLGGHVAAAVAARVPDLVSRLVMIGSMGLDQLSAERIAAIRGGLSDMSFAAVRSRLLTVFNDPALITDDLVREDTLVNTSPGAIACLQKFGTYLASSFNKELAIDDLVALDGKVPLLLIWGEDDRSAPVAVAHAVRTRLSHAQLAVMHGINHTPYIESPELFCRILQAFLCDDAIVLDRAVSYY